MVHYYHNIYICIYIYTWICNNALTMDIYIYIIWSNMVIWFNMIMLPWIYDVVMGFEASLLIMVYQN